MGNVVSLQVGLKPMSLGFASEELFGSKQSFGISDLPRCGSAGSSNNGGPISLRLIRTNKRLHTICAAGKSDFFIGNRA